MRAPGSADQAFPRMMLSETSTNIADRAVTYLAMAPRIDRHLDGLINVIVRCLFLPKECSSGLQWRRRKSCVRHLGGPCMIPCWFAYEFTKSEMELPAVGRLSAGSSKIANCCISALSNACATVTQLVDRCGCLLCQNISKKVSGTHVPWFGAQVNSWQLRASVRLSYSQAGALAVMSIS